MPSKAQRKQVVAASVDVTKDKKLVSSTSEPVALADVSLPTANVGMSASYTRNLGEFNSVKVSVTLHMPVVVDLKPGADNTAAIDKEFARVRDWVDTRLTELLEAVDE